MNDFQKKLIKEMIETLLDDPASFAADESEIKTIPEAVKGIAQELGITLDARMP